MTAEGVNNPLWGARLYQRSAVSRVVVHPRTDYHQDKINGVEVITKIERSKSCLN